MWGDCSPVGGGDWSTNMACSVSVGLTCSGSGSLCYTRKQIYKWNIFETNLLRKKIGKVHLGLQDLDLSFLSLSYIGKALPGVSRVHEIWELLLKKTTIKAHCRDFQQSLCRNALQGIDVKYENTGLLHMLPVLEKLFILIQCLML